MVAARRQPRTFAYSLHRARSTFDFQPELHEPKQLSSVLAVAVAALAAAALVVAWGSAPSQCQTAPFIPLPSVLAVLVAAQLRTEPQEVRLVSLRSFLLRAVLVELAAPTAWEALVAPAIPRRAGLAVKVVAQAREAVVAVGAASSLRRLVAPVVVVARVMAAVAVGLRMRADPVVVMPAAAVAHLVEEPIRVSVARIATAQRCPGRLRGLSERLRHSNFLHPCRFSIYPEEEAAVAVAPPLAAEMVRPGQAAAAETMEPAALVVMAECLAAAPALAGQAPAELAAVKAELVAAEEEEPLVTRKLEPAATAL